MRIVWCLAALAAAAPLSQAAEGEVLLRNGVFEPAALSLDAGGGLLFVNVDDRPHTVTSAWDGGDALDAVLRPGDAVPVSFARSGTYEIRCTPHSSHEGGALSGMVATVEVRAPGGDTGLGSPWAVGAILAGAGLAALIFARGAMRAPSQARS